MNRQLNNTRIALLHTLVLASSVCLRAASPSADWQHQQRFETTAVGFVKLSLPVETLDAARSGLEDLRVYDAEGNEVPYLIERPRPTGRVVRAPRSFGSTLDSEGTTVKIDTGFNQQIGGVSLETPAISFIKSVQVEGSKDGKQWQRLSTGQPIFREPGGASQVYLPITPQAWPWLQVRVDDRRSQPIPFIGAQIHAAEPEAIPAELVPVTIADRHENPGVTRVSLRLPGANLDLASLWVETSDPLFTRQVTVTVPQVSGDAIREQTVSQGVIYRVSVEGESAATNLTVSVESRILSRELLLLIKNQDSPPLAISAVHAERRPVYVIFYARQAGVFRLLTGNSRCGAPRYDLASLGGGLKNLSLAAIPVSPIEDNPGYRAAELLPGVQDGATALEISEWKFRKPLKLASSGAQQLELDPDVLSHTQPGFEDIRLVRGGKQVPYILERTSISRRLTPAVNATTDAKEPKLSRWTLKFERSNLPLTSMRCAAATPLFKRDVDLFEERQDERGETYRRSLANALWVRTPENPVKEFVLPLDGSPRSDVLLLEANNGDNPAIELEKFQADYVATRILFKVKAGEELFLYYGNVSATAPRYDLSLVAGQLLAADKSVVSAGAEQQLKKSTWSETHAAGKGGWVFWGILGVVVIVLLTIISRLLPKSQTS